MAFLYSRWRSSIVYIKFYSIQYMATIYSSYGSFSIDHIQRYPTMGIWRFYNIVYIKFYSIQQMAFLQLIGIGVSLYSIYQVLLYSVYGVPLFHIYSHIWQTLFQYGVPLLWVSDKFLSILYLAFSSILYLGVIIFYRVGNSSIQQMANSILVWCSLQYSHSGNSLYSISIGQFLYYGYLAFVQPILLATSILVQIVYHIYYSISFLLQWPVPIYSISRRFLYYGYSSNAILYWQLLYSNSVVFQPVYIYRSLIYSNMAFYMVMIYL